MLTEDYCSYEVTKLLKEKGFDEICDHYIDCHWKEDGVLQHTPCKLSDLLFGYMCPTHQMAMKWLRGNNIIIIPQPEYFSCDKCKSWGIDIWAGDNYEKSLQGFPTYEEAVEAALKWCPTELL